MPDKDLHSQTKYHSTDKKNYFFRENQQAIDGSWLWGIGTDLNTAPARSGRNLLVFVATSK